MRRLFIIIIFCCFSIPNLWAQDTHPITVEDLFALGRVSDPQISPDGKWVAYSVTYYSMETNKSNSDIWLVPLAGGEPRQLTTSPKADHTPRFSPDGQTIAFISAREETPQIYLIPMSGGEATKLSNISTGASGVIWSPDGNYLAFTSEVYPDLKTDEENKKRDEEKEKSLVKARIIDHLLFRHWNRWRDDKRSHVFVMKATGGQAWDVTPGDYDTPPISLGGRQDYVFSPDSKEIAFVRNTDPVVAISTNNDIFIVPVTEGSLQLEPKRITENKGNDNSPVYSPDGRYLAYKAMARPGFEADEYDLILYERATGKRTNLTQKFDRSVDEFVFSPRGDKIYFTAEDQGRHGIYALSIKTEAVTKLIGEHYNTNLRLDPKGETLVFTRQSIRLPNEVFKAYVKGQKLVQLTYTNKERLAKLDMNPVEDFWFDSFDGTRIHGLMVKPPQFDPNKKYPLIYLIHGGPQGAWGDNFHYRWNAQMFAAPGYVVAMVNFRGSSGYGQAFCDAVSKNWGGGPYQDLMAGLDYLLKTYDFIDPEKLAAAGASYGGFMIDWIAGHTDRFKVLVSHDGVFDQRSMYGSTEELWFPEWEFNGTPYENPELYEKWSPSYFVKNFKTPTLVIHGENDFRVPVTQGIQMFTALQRMGVPSRFLYFPDEDHFVTKPQNARLWWQTVHEWIAEWINK
ncbi:MAG: S9 family peptidase [candidate division KSB1 bacterium]|nr:S9 family peptidase [candidate division KSB1 bacterium]